MRERLRNIEWCLDALPRPPCKTCGSTDGKITYMHADITYVDDPPQKPFVCEECGARPWTRFEIEVAGGASMEEKVRRNP